ncbi:MULTISPECIES: virulence factor [unclassified Rhizobium]|uniref:virulence factor n=2 Tax=unclassified Rhizobium TaxID=2613769 RepID=UPI001ADD2DE0|nr:virulence factor family protein [Rhizobium sp. L58/93]MBO9131818.1 virulence factor family protein [Rhizobium sp. B209b/85]MBO9169640.1 virulence factor family protein [Rhizobium sp. L245/93]MBO9185589.1 virulence factor family protein [Rhizobium sp. E27B/91]QXZ82344.1 virulence factor family protein [Rhizobium sp. K1/93]QXZ90143.1 virulence factor family protein [Rhizobium sp. K15/93]QXZ95616.1 virulence factor family protein [Rhizobium sp. B230/85]QYA02683.1 virulence factor family prot
MILKYAASFAMAALLMLGVAHADEVNKKYDTGIIPSPHILVPTGKVVGEVVLISDIGGWGDKENAVAQTLLAKGSMVIGIDYPSFLKALNNYDVSQNDGCIYMVSDIESLSQQVQRSVADSAYELPIIAGVGAGGTMALAIAAQTPDATVSQTLAVDPAAGIALTKDLCTPAEKVKTGDNVVIGLMDGVLPNPIIASFTPAAPKDGRDHVEAMQKDHPEIEIRDSTDDAMTTLSNTLVDLVKSLSAEKSPLGLPINVLETKPTEDTLAIIYSGDGGWRDIDKEVGSYLQDQGIPVVGVDTLHYFWSERKPQETADDLGRIIDYYTKHFNVQHVVLIGYSFGADVIPASYNLLKPKERSQVVQMSLLSLSRKVDYVISVMGWLGASSEGKGGDPLKDLKKINPKIVQCVYGTDDDEDVACPDLKGTGAEVVAMAGGHHFDDDYETLSKTIIAGVKSRLGE